MPKKLNILDSIRMYELYNFENESCADIAKRYGYPSSQPVKDRIIRINRLLNWKNGKTSLDDLRYFHEILSPFLEKTDNAIYSMITRYGIRTKSDFLNLSEQDIRNGYEIRSISKPEITYPCHYEAFAEWDGRNHIGHYVADIKFPKDMKERFLKIRGFWNENDETHYYRDIPLNLLPYIANKGATKEELIMAFDLIINGCTNSDFLKQLKEKYGYTG